MRPYRRFAYLFLPFVLVSMLAASAVFAASTTGISMPSGNDVIKAIMTFIFGDCASVQGNCIPDEWMTYGGFMQYIIFPFIAVFVVMYGILSEIKIFHNTSVKAVLSLVMAFVGGSWTLGFMRNALIANSVWGTFAWAVLMVVGIALWLFRGLAENYRLGFGTFKDAASVQRRYRERDMKITDLNTRITQDYARFSSATSVKEQKLWSDRLSADEELRNRLLEEKESAAR
jgi:hypothetical protein